MDEDNTFPQLIEALAHTQGSALALNYILMEVVRYLARQSGDPEKLLSGLYEGVYARLDNAPADKPHKQAELDMIDTVDRFFANARKWTN
ncbi:MAG TPA: hypothetical protein VGB65_04440 [Allosphingosinicella sp.]